ncbi:hypothetical protein [Flavobacterium sp. TAB 87]|uniref:hypothetical protein n=1 Tax=Flavobacterium sp. TAB 87 TaxID=1729581 RepID=UPI00076D2978|nr:hypothetical protein [Flavobacterium sp. TAB 87]KVV14596.1 hypothetical protein AP058_01648 [Flavobacterium sp. TAB 87]
MAQQKGIIKLRGTIGDITFYKTKDGHMAREKGGVDAKRIANDPAFQRTRENGSEFGRAGKAGKILRSSIRSLLLNAADSRMVSRLTQSMIKVIQADTTSVRGLRNVIDGEAELLIGFEFNINSTLDSTIYVPYQASINRVTGAILLEIPSFVPADMIVAPSGATHFKILSAGTEIDFESETFLEAHTETAVLPLNKLPTVAITHSNIVTPNSTKPLFLVMGLEFYQEVNGTMYTLKNGMYNPLSVVTVSGL